MTDVSPGVWSRLGLDPLSEVHAGHQSRVFLASGRSGRLVVKMIEPRRGDGDVTRERAELSRRLAELNPAVVGPVEVASNLVNDIDGRYVVCYPYVEGTTPRTGDRDDVEAMAVALSALHSSLEAVGPAELPPVAALAAGSRLPVDDLVIHGDYAAANLIVAPSGLKVIDFDECGYGSVDFEIGNSLYLVLFDAWNAGDLDRYEAFRSWFVDAYRSASQRNVEDASLDDAIRIRARALGRWLDEPARAPTGIRTTTPEWRARLRSFIDGFPP